MATTAQRTVSGMPARKHAHRALGVSEPVLSRRHFIALAGQAVAGGTLLAACGNGESGSGQPVEYWRGFADVQTRNFVQASVVDAFNAEREGNARLVAKPQDTFDQLTRTALAARRGPDIVACTGPTGALAYQEAGYLAALDEHASRYGWRDRLQAWAVGAGTIDDKLYSVPANYASMVLFYNRELFAEAGWRPPATRAEFEALCDDAAARGLVPVAAGNAEYRPASEWHATIFFNYVAGPAAVHDALVGDLSWSDGRFVEAISLLKGYFDRGWYGGGAESYLTSRFAGLYSKLAQGKAAMLLSGTWSFAELAPFFGEQAGTDAVWEWAPLPALGGETPKETFALSVGTAFAVNARSDVDAAARFLDWLIDDKERQVAGLAQVNLSPAPLRFDDADFQAGVDARVRRLYVDLGEARSFAYPTWVFFPPRTNTYIWESLDKVVTGQMTPAEYCAGLDEVFSGELAAGKVPPVPAPTA